MGCCRSVVGIGVFFVSTEWPLPFALICLEQGRKAETHFSTAAVTWLASVTLAWRIYFPFQHSPHDCSRMQHRCWLSLAAWLQCCSCLWLDQIPFRGWGRSRWCWMYAEGLPTWFSPLPITPGTRIWFIFSCSDAPFITEAPRGVFPCGMDAHCLFLLSWAPCSLWCALVPFCLFTSVPARVSCHKAGCDSVKFLVILQFHYFNGEILVAGGWLDWMIIDRGFSQPWWFCDSLS